MRKNRAEYFLKKSQAVGIAEDSGDNRRYYIDSKQTGRRAAHIHLQPSCVFVKRQIAFLYICAYASSAFLGDLISCGIGGSEMLSTLYCYLCLVTLSYLGKCA